MFDYKEACKDGAWVFTQEIDVAELACYFLYKEKFKVAPGEKPKITPVTYGRFESQPGEKDATALIKQYLGLVETIPNYVSALTNFLKGQLQIERLSMEKFYMDMKKKIKEALAKDLGREPSRDDLAPYYKYADFIHRQLEAQLKGIFDGIFEDYTKLPETAVAATRVMKGLKK